MKTSRDLRELLFATLDDIRADRCKPEKAAAISKISAQIIASVAVEIEFYTHVTKGLDAGGRLPNTTIVLTRPTAAPSQRTELMPLATPKIESKPDAQECASTREQIAAVAKRNGL